jgi:hypothetical protein
VLRLYYCNVWKMRVSQVTWVRVTVINNRLHYLENPVSQITSFCCQGDLVFWPLILQMSIQLLLKIAILLNIQMIYWLQLICLSLQKNHYYRIGSRGVLKLLYFFRICQNPVMAHFNVIVMIVGYSFLGSKLTLMGFLWMI